jgi:hypothetical protein
MARFWSNKHELSAIKEKLWDEFMPASGKSEYVEIECLRAVNRLYHDFFNNGFGNNMSHAIAYIEKYQLPVATSTFKENFADVKEAAEQPWIESTVADQLDIIMAEIVIRAAIADQNEKLTPLVEELFDMPYREIDYPQDDDDDDEDDR